MIILEHLFYNYNYEMLQKTIFKTGGLAMYTNITHPNAWTEIWTVKLVGSTFRSSNGCSRQAALKRAAKMQDDFESFDTDLERYEYDGSPAYHVLFDDREVGNVPADIASGLASMEDSGYTVYCDSCWVYGGPTDDEPDRHYGAELKIVVRRKQTDSERQAVLYDLAQKAKHYEAAQPVSSAPAQAAPVLDEAARCEKIRADGRKTRRSIIIVALILCLACFLFIRVIPDILYALGF